MGEGVCSNALIRVVVLQVEFHNILSDIIFIFFLRMKIAIYKRDRHKYKNLWSLEHYYFLIFFKHYYLVANRVVKIE